MSAVRFNPPLVNNNPDAPRARKRQAKPADPVGKRELVNPTLQEFPSPNSPLFNQGLTVVRKTLGREAFQVMYELGTHRPWFQLNPERVAELTEMSQTVCNRAIKRLIDAGYMERVPCRKGGRWFGHVLHSCLAGNIQKLDGFVTHYSVDANTKEAATRHARRKVLKASHNPSNPDRPRKGGKRTRRAVGDESVRAASTIQDPDVQAPVVDEALVPVPPSPYIGNVTDEGENESLPTSLSGGKEGAQTFFYPEGSSVGVSKVEGENQEADPYPLCPVAHPELRSSWNNAMVRALTAPEWESGVHVGYDRFSTYAPAAFEKPLDDLCLEDSDFGFGTIPRHELNGDGAKLWISAHKLGIAIMQCFKNFNDVTNLEAFQIVKQLRSGKMTRAFVLRTWAEITTGARSLFTNGHDYLRAWNERHLPSATEDHDRICLLDVLNTDCGSVLIEECNVEVDADDVWRRLVAEGERVYASVQAMQGYRLTLSARLETYVEDPHANTFRVSKLEAFTALWTHSALVGDSDMLHLLRSDASTASLRRCLLKRSKGRSMVRSIRHMQKKGEVNFNLATEAGWHSFEEFDVLAKFHAIMATEALRVLSYRN